MLEEEFGRGIDVEIAPGVRAANDHDGHADVICLVDAVVVDWGLEVVGVVFGTGGIRDRSWEEGRYHFGKLRACVSIVDRSMMTRH